VKLVVGLGNPGSQYAGTRHNIGFEVLSRLATRWNTPAPRAKFQGEVAEAAVGAEKVLLLWPLTFMNLSGASVLAARDFYKLPHADLMVICDDLNLPTGKVRVRGKGSAGGQKGLDDILRRLGADDVPRLRIGIGQVPPGRETTGYVLGKFTTDEQQAVGPAVAKAADAVATWVAQGITACMNQYNAD
jgi:PTH1 family peptidyl-tRNA hydrolase